MSKTTSADAALLDDIRGSFAKDGLQWAMPSERKLVHLWRKLLRTEEELRKTSIEINQLKKKQKEETAGVQEFVEKIKSLSQEKEAFTLSLEKENEALQEQVSQLTAQNEAFMQETASIAELCLAEGIRDDSGGIPEQPVQFLIKERVQFMEKVGEDKGKTKQLAQELERMKLELIRMKEMEKQTFLLEQQLSESQANLEREQSKLVTIKADHSKQKKMHQKQIHDLRDKLSNFEASKSATQESRSDQLQEALAQVATLTSELNKSTEIAQDTDRRNTALFEKLSKANIVNESLSQQLEQLNEEMSQERDKSVSILEEELQRQHDLQSLLETSQQDLYTMKTQMTALAEELQQEHQLNEELEAKAQQLEQALHEKESLGLEKSLLQAAVTEKEHNIEALEEEVSALKSAKQSVATKNILIEAEVKDLSSIKDELNFKLLEAVKAKRESGREIEVLQEKVAALRAQTDSLKDTLEETRTSVDRERTEVRSIKDLMKNQKSAMADQLSLVEAEKEELLSQLEEESSRQDKVRESLNSSVSQLQDELHSKCEELSRAQLEIQQMQRESTSLKQNLETEMVCKNESEHQLESLQSENKTLHDTISQLKTEMKLKESQAIVSQQELESETESKLRKKGREIESLQSKLKAVSAESNLTKAALTERLKTANDSNQGQLDAAQGRIKAAEERISELLSEAEARDKELSDAVQKVEMIEAEKGSLESSLGALQKDFDSAKLLYSTSSTSLSEEKAQLHKQMEAHKKQLKLSEAEFEAEKANLQAQVATLKSRQMSLEQQVQVNCTYLESEKSRSKSLSADLESKTQGLAAVQRELEALKGELIVMTKKAEENSNHVRILASSCNESKIIIAAKEKDCEQALAEKAEIESRMREVEQALQESQKREEELGAQLSQAVSTSDEAVAKLESKEQALSEAVQHQVEAEGKWEEAQAALEREQLQGAKLEGQRDAALHSQSKGKEQIQELTQKIETLQSRVKKMEIENMKISSISRRYESKLAKKIIELTESQGEKGKADTKLAQAEQRLSALQQKVPTLERKASSESEVISLREQLQQEKLQKLLNGQAVTNLQEKVSSLEEQKSGLEAQLKEKQNTLLDSETNAREQKNKAQKSKDKLKAALSEKVALEEEVQSLQLEVEFYKGSLAQLQDKMERVRSKYSSRKRHSEDKLASSKTNFSRERRSLEYTIDEVKDELRTAKNQLDCEHQWKDRAENLHKQLLEEKSELATKLVAAEEKVRDSGQQVLEVEMKLNRVQKENIMLEERNKILSSQLENSVPTTPTEVLQMNTSFSSSNGLQSLLALSARKFSSPLSSTQHFTTPLSPENHTHQRLFASQTSPAGPAYQQQFTTPLTPPTGTAHQQQFTTPLTPDPTHQQQQFTPSDPTHQYFTTPLTPADHTHRFTLPTSPLPNGSTVTPPPTHSHTH